MSALDEMANTGLGCQGCGLETTRLFDGSHCAVCRFGYLENRQANITTALEMFEYALTATLNQGVHPEDVRRAFERGIAECHASTGNYGMTCIRRSKGCGTG